MRATKVVPQQGLITSASADRYAQNSSPGFIDTFSILEETVIELEIDTLTTSKSEDKTNQIEADGIAEEQLGGNKEMCQETGQARISPDATLNELYAKSMKNARIENSHSNEDASADIKDSGGIDITMYNSDIFAEGEMGYGTHMCIEVVSGDPLADEFKTKENQHSQMMATMDGSRSSMKFETKFQEPEVKKAKN